jgi:hypothetical protein
MIRERVRGRNVKITVYSPFQSPFHSWTYKILGTGTRHECTTRYYRTVEVTGTKKYRIFGKGPLV